MEEFLDAIFAIRWWQWLAGTVAAAGLYYVVAALTLPFFKRVQVEHEEEEERKRQEEEEERKRQERQAREAERREYLKRIPSGPVEPLDLAKATVRVRHRSLRLPTDAEVTFGTQRGVTVAVMARGVSRQHAKIRPEPRGYVLYDLLSQTGTFVAGSRVESKVLADGDVIRIGPVEILFQLGEAPKDE